MPDRVIEFWCRLGLELSAVFEKFRSEFPVRDYIHDAEDVWEWFDGRTADGLIGFNITRQWDDDFIPDEPIRISLSIRDPLIAVEVTGSRLASALGTAVRTGTVKYLQSDDFEFCVERTFKH